VRVALLLLLLSACTPRLFYSRAALPDEEPFDALVSIDLFSKIEFRQVGAIVMSGRDPDALEIVQCLACHRAAEHPPIRQEAERYEYTPG